MDPLMAGATPQDKEMDGVLLAPMIVVGCQRLRMKDHFNDKPLIGYDDSVGFLSWFECDAM